MAMPNEDIALRNFAELMKSVHTVRMVQTAFDVASGKDVMSVHMHSGQVHSFTEASEAAKFIMEQRMAVEKAERPDESPKNDVHQVTHVEDKSAFEKDLIQKQHDAMKRAYDNRLTVTETAEELAFANKVALTNAANHGEPLPLDKLEEVDPDAFDVVKTVQKHKAKGEDFELGAVKIVDISDDVEVEPDKRAVKVEVAAYGFTLSEIIVGPKDGDHLKLSVEYVERMTHRLFTVIDALRAKNIRIR